MIERQVLHTRHACASGGICKRAFLQINENVKLSKEFWMPTLSAKANMDKEEVEDFFALTTLPENLIKLFF